MNRRPGAPVFQICWWAFSMLLFSLACARAQPGSFELPQLELPAIPFFQPAASPSSTASIQPTIAPFPDPASQAPSALARYALQVELAWRSGELRVRQELDLPHPGGQTFDTLPLIVEANRNPGVFTLLALTTLGGEETLPYTLDEAVLSLELPQPWPAGQRLQLQIEYRLDLPQRAAPLGRTGDEITLHDWYPLLPAYHPQRGWLIHEPGLVGEHLPYPQADFELRFSLDDAGAAPDLQLVAGAPVEQRDDGWHVKLRSARACSLALLADARRIVRQGQGWTVVAYVPERLAGAGQASAQVTLLAAQHFEKLFGAPTRRFLAIAAVRFPDGLESSGMFFLNQGYFETYDGTERNYLTLLSVHEAAHQWWFELVGNDPAYEPWLDEALATYSEALFLEQAHPESVAWWWRFRVNAYRPRGKVDSRIYDHPGFRPYVDAVYLRGAEFLEAFRNLLGEERFLQLLQEYRAANSGRIATAGEFFALIPENDAREDIQALLEEYFSIQSP